MNVLLIGPPGSGKGTQGERLAERLGLEHLAAGDLLRSEVADGTEVGVQVQDIMRRGELVPDDVVLALLMPRVLAAAQTTGYLLDGFPRTVAQAERARKITEEAHAEPNAVIYLEAPRSELIRRILARAKILGRIDDNEKTAENRLRVFDEATKPLLAHYQGRGLVHVVDANQELDAVTDEILRVLRAAR